VERPAADAPHRPRPRPLLRRPGGPPREEGETTTREAGGRFARRGNMSGEQGCCTEKINLQLMVCGELKQGGNFFLSSGYIAMLQDGKMRLN